MPPLSIELNQRISVPQLGFGVFMVPPDDAQRIVEQALEVGYRHIDTAAAYNNESGVGAAVRASGLPRDEIFITSKLRNGEQGYESALTAYKDSCDRMGLDYLDLYLIHWPVPAAGLYADSWRALESLYRNGSVRSVGVSNFLPEHLDTLRETSELVPAVNQIELHPTYQQAELVDVNRQRGIAVEAYSPLGRAADLDSPVVTGIAKERDLTAAQVILRWHLQSGFIVIPKSGTHSRMVSNFSVGEFTLTDEEMARIDSLEAGNRTGNDPMTFSISQISQ